MKPGIRRTAVALLLESAALVLLALVVLGKPWPAERGGALVRLLVDRSASAPREAVDEAVRDVLVAARQSTQPAALQAIDFAAQPGGPRRLESGPGAEPAKANDSTDENGTNLQAAIERALGGPGDALPSAIVVVSDGNATDGDTERALNAAADAGVPILWRVVRPLASAARIAEVLAPQRVLPGQDVAVLVRLAGRSETPLRLLLSARGDSSPPAVADVASGELGATPMRWRAGAAGTRLLDVELIDAATNRRIDARDGAAALDVEPPADVLYVASGPAALERSLRAGGWSIDTVAPSGLDARAASLARYAAVILDDVPASAASSGTWEALDESVRGRGTGLLVLGGERSFSAGSYRDSQLEALLPVASKPVGLGDSAALAFVVDKSGSMGASAAGVDRYRLAQRAVVETAATLTQRDSAALVVFDVAARELLPLQGADEFRSAVSRPWPARPRGGTRLRPALDAALAQLESATASRRILVLVTDGFVDEPPDRDLLERLSRTRVELIALAVGPDADVAALTQLFPGERSTILRVAEAAELPSMMRQGLEQRRAPIERGRIAARERQPVPFLADASREWPLVAAYDVTSPATDAIVHVESGRGDPLIASRQAGLGRVVAVTPGLGAWTPEWLRWRQWPRLAGGLLEWVRRADDDAGSSVSVHGRPGALRIDVDRADGGRWSDAGEGRLRVRHPSGRTTDLPLVASGPGRMGAEVDAPEYGLYSLAVSTPSGAERKVHLHQPRRELGALDSNPGIATWRDEGLVRDWSARELQTALRDVRPADRAAGRALLLALVLFLLAVLAERGGSLAPGLRPQHLPEPLRVAERIDGRNVG